jgi:hypothetical protein
MKDDMLREKFEDIERSLDRLRREVNPEIKIEEGVKHSIVWATALIIIALIIKWMIG